MNYGKCSRCSCDMTFDYKSMYGDLCFDCCSKAWKSFEFAHGGECTADVKRTSISHTLKEYIINRDKKCLKCGSKSDLTIDHVVPVTQKCW